jgi:alginate O-acetyltransferase complex protein AlgI
VLFNSFDFGLFLIITYGVYWLIGAGNRKAQNIFLLIASYFFYAVWDWRFLGLLVSSSLVDYFAGISIAATPSKTSRKVILYASLIWNLGVLFVFKYFNFFIESFESLFQLSASSSYHFWNVAIPVGLSFYTFQTMGYTIDVFQKKITPSRNILNFLCFVSFFPQLVAGPIEKAKSLLPQFDRNRTFDLQKSKEGLRQILWGLFKKIIVAEKLGLAVNMAFDNPESYNFITLTYAVILFCFQIYCDFSGYTDIAIGTAKLFGFNLSRNFRLPYLAKSISEFWQRWHITLTRWFSDYVYSPILNSFKEKSTAVRVLALLITMTLVGLWHGARWTFICFGIFNALLMILERIPIFKKRFTLRKRLSLAPRWISLGYVFLVFLISGVLFRSSSLTQAIFIFKRIFSFTWDGAFTSLISWKLTYLLFMIIAELTFRRMDYPLQALERFIPRPLRWTLYYLLIFFIIRYAEAKESFIYFQF